MNHTLLSHSLPLIALLAAPVVAQSISFTNHCESNSSAAERDIIRAAYAFAYEHRYDLWNEIDRRRDAGNTEGYEDVSDTRRNRWLREIERVTMNCEMGACARKPHLYGRCCLAAIGGGSINPFDATGVCIDNLEALAAACGHTSAVPYVAGTLAHEVMHQCDGWEGHPGGSTVPENPQTDAETVGVAMEHMALTPDLAVSITSLKQRISSFGSPYLEVVVRVYNRNELSGPTAAVGRSKRSRNSSTLLGLEVDGVLRRTATVAAIAGGASADVTITYGTADGYSPSRASYAIAVAADHTDVLTEYDEANNSASDVFEPDCDLAISRFAIAGPYSTVSYRGGTARRLTYDVEVVNQSTRNHSPATVLRQIGPSVGLILQPSRTQDHALPSLAPLGAASFLLTVDVPVTSAVTYGSLWLGVDPDVTLRDAERANNELSVTYNAAYFRPDYTVWFDELALSESGGVLARFTVKNVGPESGVLCQAGLSASSGTRLTRSVMGLAAAASASYQFDMADCFIPVGQTADFTLTIDTRNTVTEGDEGNNVATAWLRNGVAIDNIRNWMGQTFEVDQPHWLDTHRFAWIEVQLGLIDRFLWTHTRYSSSGPFMERPATCLVQTGNRTYLASFVSPQRTLPTVRQFTASQGSAYQAQRFQGHNGPAGQTFWR